MSCFLPMDYAANPGQGVLPLGYAIGVAVGEHLGGTKTCQSPSLQTAQWIWVLGQFAKKTHLCLHRFVHRCFKICGSQAVNT